MKFIYIKCISKIFSAFPKTEPILNTWIIALKEKDEATINELGLLVKSKMVHQCEPGAKSHHYYTKHVYS